MEGAVVSTIDLSGDLGKSGSKDSCSKRSGSKSEYWGQSLGEEGKGENVVSFDKIGSEGKFVLLLEKFWFAVMKLWFEIRLELGRGLLNFNLFAF